MATHLTGSQATCQQTQYSNDGMKFGLRAGLRHKIPQWAKQLKERLLVLSLKRNLCVSSWARKGKANGKHLSGTTIDDSCYQLQSSKAVSFLDLHGRHWLISKGIANGIKFESLLATSPRTRSEEVYIYSQWFLFWMGGVGGHHLLSNSSCKLRHLDSCKPISSSLLIEFHHGESCLLVSTYMAAWHETCGRALVLTRNEYCQEIGGLKSSEELTVSLPPSMLHGKSPNLMRWVCLSCSPLTTMMRGSPKACKTEDQVSSSAQKGNG